MALGVAVQSASTSSPDDRMARTPMQECRELSAADLELVRRHRLRAWCARELPLGLKGFLGSSMSRRMIGVSQGPGTPRSVAVRLGRAASAEAGSSCPPSNHRDRGRPACLRVSRSDRPRLLPFPSPFVESVRGVTIARGRDSCASQQSESLPDFYGTERAEVGLFSPGVENPSPETAI